MTITQKNLFLSYLINTYKVFYEIFHLLFINTIGKNILTFLISFGSVFVFGLIINFGDE